MLSLRVFTVLANQKEVVLLIPIFSPLCDIHTWKSWTKAALVLRTVLSLLSYWQVGYKFLIENEFNIIKLIWLSKNDHGKAWMNNYKKTKVNMNEHKWSHKNMNQHQKIWRDINKEAPINTNNIYQKTPTIIINTNKHLQTPKTPTRTNKHQ